MKAKKFDLAIDGRIGPITSRDWFYDQGSESYTRTMMALNLWKDWVLILLYVSL